MAAAAGRAIRISYDDGGTGGAVAITGSTQDGFEITKEGINITDKDDLGVQTFIDDVVGTWAMSGTVEGIIKNDTILLLANDSGQFTYDMEVAVAGFGTYTGKFGLSNFSVNGQEGAEAATYTFQLQSSGAQAYA